MDNFEEDFKNRKRNQKRWEAITTDYQSYKALQEQYRRNREKEIRKAFNEKFDIAEKNLYIQLWEPLYE